MRPLAIAIVGISLQMVIDGWDGTNLKRLLRNMVASCHTARAAAFNSPCRGNPSTAPVAVDQDGPMMTENL